MATCGLEDDCDDCVQVVRETKTVEVPCVRNTYQPYTVKVPRQVTEQVPRTVTYTDYETRSKQVPYTVSRTEKRVRMETQKYQVPVTRYYRKTVMETRERQVPVEYFVNVPETKYQTVTEQVPVQRSKVEMETVVKTVYDTQTRTRCVPETKVVRKTIPVYNVIPKPAPPCPPEIDCGAEITDDKKETTFDAVDTNKDGVISRNEFQSGVGSGKISVASGPEYRE